MLVYSADFWEHGPSVAAGLWAITLALGLPDTRSGRSAAARAVALGIVAALAVLLRLEVALALASVGLGLLVVRVERRRVLGAARWFVVAGAVAGVGYVGWSRVESRMLGSAVRSSRGGSQLSDVGSDLAQRGQDAALTAVGVWANDSPIFLIAGFAVIALLGVAVVRERSGDPLSPLLAMAAPLILALRALTGLGFVPGALPAAPGSAAALAARTSRERALAVGAVLGMVATWALQWKGGMLAQWGGRYLLVPAALLTVVGAVSMERTGWRKPAVLAVVASSVIVSGFGAVWHVVRSNGVAAAITEVEAVPADVLIVATGVDSGRTSGAWYGDHRWLTATGGDLDEVMELAARCGRDPGGRRLPGTARRGAADRRRPGGGSPGDRRGLGHRLHRGELRTHRLNALVYEQSFARLRGPLGFPSWPNVSSSAVPVNTTCATSISTSRATELIVFTGLSGSGKSSLAFDTIYAEGQRRYVESLSAYARQFLGQMDKPDVDVIEGLSPAISIDQKSASRNPRSTVGTITEVYDYLRLLYARIGVPIARTTTHRSNVRPRARSSTACSSSPKAPGSRCSPPWSVAARAPTTRCSPIWPGKGSCAPSWMVS